MFQIPDAEGDPLTRTAALFSLVCALMSLSYGCIYIVRFGTMRSMYRASRWAEVTFHCDKFVYHYLTTAAFLKEARKTNTVIWWNVWVLLAMPAIWIAWYLFLSSHPSIKYSMSIHTQVNALFCCLHSIICLAHGICYRSPAADATQSEWRPWCPNRRYCGIRVGGVLFANDCENPKTLWSS